MNRCDICLLPITDGKLIKTEITVILEDGSKSKEKIYRYEHHNCAGITIVRARINDEDVAI